MTPPNQPLDAQAEEKLALIFGRRTTRVFTDGAVPDSAVTRLLQAAMAAPSAAGYEAWRFVVIRGEAVLCGLSSLLTNGQVLLTAPLAIAVCGDLERGYERHLSYLLQDCAAATQNLLLAAHALGLGTCWLAVHPDEKKTQAVSQMLGLPPSFIPVTCVAIGHPETPQKPRTRFNPEFVRLERWGGA
jgi:nitroreductase